MFTEPTALRPEIYLLIAIFAIGEQKSALAKERRMHFVTSDEMPKVKASAFCI